MILAAWDDLNARLDVVAKVKSPSGDMAIGEADEANICAHANPSVVSKITSKLAVRRSDAGRLSAANVGKKVPTNH